MSGQHRWVLPAICSITAALFIAAVVFFTYRDHRAVDRCHALGGQTWDSGEHCVLDGGRVVNTHNRTWG